MNQGVCFFNLLIFIDIFFVAIGLCTIVGRFVIINLCRIEHMFMIMLKSTL